MSATEQPAAWAQDTDIYCTDDYPREGCTLKIDIKRICGSVHYTLRVYAPYGGFSIEGYGTTNPVALGRMVREWCEGRAPKLHHPSDQEASGS